VGLPATTSCLGAIAINLDCPLTYPGEPVRFTQGTDGIVVVNIPLPGASIPDPPEPPTNAPTMSPALDPSLSIGYVDNTGSDPASGVTFSTSASDIYGDSGASITGPAGLNLEYFKYHRWHWGPFSYTVSGFVPFSTQVLTLGFAEIYQPNCVTGERVMTVDVNGAGFVANLDVFDEAGCSAVHLETHDVVADSSVTLVINFSASVNTPMVSFLEINEPATEATEVPTASPTVQPTTVSPTEQPVGTPSDQPATEVPTVSPTVQPTTVSPTEHPVGTPSNQPSPSTYGSGRMESIVVSSVNDQWQQVPLSGFVDPIPVCSVYYETAAIILPAVVRVKNVGTNSFEIKLQNPGDTAIPVGREVNCLVVDKGSWQLSNGKRVLAHSYTSTVTDRKSSWNGQSQIGSVDLSLFSNPVVVGQVMSANDASWSVFWSHGSNWRLKATATQFFAGKHVGEDPDQLRLNEEIGYIIMEESHGIASGIAYEASVTTDTVRGYNNRRTGYTHSFKTAFSDVPMVVLSMAAVDGNDGGWAILAGGQSATALSSVVDEDQLSGNERFHTAEELSYIAISTTGPLILT
jgi:hypothetical protein